MSKVETSLTQKGQVTIPVEIRTRLGLKARDKVVFEMKGDTVTLRPATSKIMRLYGSVQPLRKDLVSLRKRFEEGVAREVLEEDR